MTDDAGATCETEILNEKRRCISELPRTGFPEKRRGSPRYCRLCKLVFIDIIYGSRERRSVFQTRQRLHNFHYRLKHLPMPISVLAPHGVLIQQRHAQIGIISGTEDDSWKWKLAMANVYAGKD